MTEPRLARSSTAKAVIIAALISGTALALWATLPPPPPEKGTASPVSASVALRGDPAANEGYARAHTPRPFRFPDDHGPHPEFRTEWWYFTGNLDGALGRPFGYQLTFQELEVSVRYWEGAVEARGKAHGLPVTGRGHLELTGYADG